MAGEVPGETMEEKLILFSVGTGAYAVHAQGPALWDMAAHECGNGAFVVFIIITEEGMPHIKVVHDDGLLMPQNPPDKPLPRRNADLLHVRLAVCGRERDRIVAGLIRQKEDGAVCVEGGSYKSQERVVIIVKRCHENLFQG